MTIPHEYLVAASDLDELVVEICRTLQITETQFKDAEAHYQAVGMWLRETGSPLFTLRPVIYPQGSMALLTTVRPRGREEYDPRPGPPSGADEPGSDVAVRAGL